MRPREDARAALTAEVIAVGTELVTGDLVDTNSAWVSRRLEQLGIAVERHTVIGDVRTDLAAAIARAADDHDVVVVTGGLGPTPDDITRFAVAQVADVALCRHDDLVDAIRERFTARGRDMPVSNLVQADLPEGATVVPAVGTAAGFTLRIDGALVVCLPGVPAELRTMTDDHVVAMLEALGGRRPAVTRSVRTAGAAESAVAQRCAVLERRLASSPDVALGYLAGGGEIQVRVTARAADRPGAEALAAAVVEELVALLGPWVVGLDDEGVEHLVARQLLARRWTLAVAESLTGGGVGARLVTVPGASSWFAGGLITYATPVKSFLADVPAALLEREGPVSEQVAAALASGARARLATDVALAVLGVAGPTTQGGRDVGTMCVAVALPDGDTHARTVVLPALDRTDLQQRGASVALDFLRRRLAEVAAD